MSLVMDDICLEYGANSVLILAENGMDRKTPTALSIPDFLIPEESQKNAAIIGSIHVFKYHIVGIVSKETGPASALRQSELSSERIK